MFIIAASCTKKWKYLRDKYKKEKREEQEKARSGAEGRVRRKWKHLHMLSFLEPYNLDQETTSNFDQPQSATVMLNNISFRGRTGN